MGDSNRGCGSLVLTTAFIFYSSHMAPRILMIRERRRRESARHHGPLCSLRDEFIEVAATVGSPLFPAQETATVAHTVKSAHFAFDEVWARYEDRKDGAVGPTYESEEDVADIESLHLPAATAVVVPSKLFAIRGLSKAADLKPSDDSNGGRGGHRRCEMSGTKANGQRKRRMVPGSETGECDDAGPYVRNSRDSGGFP